MYANLLIMTKKNPLTPNFGARLAQLRKDQGLTQTELGAKVGVSYRVIAYYEGETKHPPAHLLPGLARALKITTDELLGIKNKDLKKTSKEVALLRRLRKAEVLSKKDQKILLYFLEALLQKNITA